MKETTLEFEVRALVAQIDESAKRFREKADSDRHWFEEHGEPPKGTHIPSFWPLIEQWEAKSALLEEVARQLKEAMKRCELDTEAEEFEGLAGE